MPYLSVIVPAYNSESTIKRCLESIKQSSYGDYELIVVDDRSQDATPEIANKYADKVIQMDENRGRRNARKKGIEASTGQVIVNIDSDVVIRPDTLNKISDYFSQYPEVDAVTGLLSKEHSYSDFFSQYKNLYMHYIFSKLPERVSFLYGTIYAIRRESARYNDHDIGVADDTALGQQLTAEGKQITLLKDLEVVHLKKYDLFSFIRNDFQIPFDWARIFIKHRGWEQLGKKGTGYAHSPKEQLASVILAPGIAFLSVLGGLFGFSAHLLILAFVFIWFLLNVQFFSFLARQKGPVFGICSIFVTFLDNIVMAIGIISGFMVEVSLRKNNENAGE